MRERERKEAGRREVVKGEKKQANFVLPSGYLGMPLNSSDMG